jgi:hypothetical protein
MVRDLDSIVVHYRWVKPKTMKLVFVVSSLRKQHYRVRTTTGRLGIKIMCPNGATYLSGRSVCGLLFQ